MIEGIAAIRDAYRDPAVVTSYIERRFSEPIGALLHARQAATLGRIARATRPRRILELAPGPARLTIELARLGFRGTVVDASRPMLNQAQRRLAEVGPAWRAVNADAFRLPIGARMDLVYAFRFIRHFERPDRVRLYQEIARTLKPQGLFVFDAVNAAVSGPLRARARPGDYQHFDALVTPASLAAELAEARLHIVALEPVQRRFPWLQRIQTWIAPRSQRMARILMEVVERSGGAPLEWIVTCRRA